MATEEKDLSAAYDAIAQETTTRMSGHVFQLALPDMLRCDVTARPAWAIGFIRALLDVTAVVAAWTVAVALGISAYGDPRVAEIEARIGRELRRALQTAVETEVGRTDTATVIPRLATDEDAGHA